MSDVVKFIEGLKKQIDNNTHVAMLAKIVKFDPQTMKVDVQPLQKDLPMIVDIPVALQKAGPFFIRVPYEPGDVVVVVFSDFAMDGSSNAGHRIDDAIVIGGISLGSLPPEHGNALVIARDDLSLKLVISEESIDVVTQDKDINLTSQSGNINLSSTDGNVIIAGKDSSGSW